MPDDYGILAILTSFVAIFGIIYGLGIKGAITRYYYEKKTDFDQYLGSNILMVTIWSIILTALLLLSFDTLSAFFNVPPGVLYIGIGIVFFQVFLGLYQSYLVASKQSKQYGLINIIKRVLSIVFAIPLILILADEKFYGKAYAMLFLAVIFGGYGIVKLSKILVLTFRWSYIKYTLIFSLPIVLHLLSQYVLSAFDKIIINQLVGKTETGLYALAYAVGGIQGMVSMGMLKAWSPNLYDMLNKGRYDAINKLASKFARLVYLSAFALILFSREIVILLADEKYYAALNIIPIIIIAFVFHFLYTMYVNFAFYHKKTQLIAAATIIAGTINISLNYWLIPIYGFEVAAWTTLFSYATLFALHYLNVRFIIKPEWITHLTALLPNFFLLIMVVLVFSKINSLVINIYLLSAIKFLFLFFLI
ncbi:MAG: hypothetical protein D5S01_09060, partial [Halanaerobium sp. MSAO_Bac5]